MVGFTWSSSMAAPLQLDLQLVDPVDAWKPWQPTKDEWSRKWIAHLFRRAAFGAKPSEIDRALGDGLPKTLDKLLAGAPDAEALLEVYAEAGESCRETSNLQVWWLSLMLEGGHPLREKLTLFWHNHFATNINKVREISLMLEQNRTLRKHSLGKFRPFLLEISKNPAMLLWLDSNQNVKEAPNENYARELMELFSLGVGNYTEKDIREAARAFTGWHTDSSYPHEAFEFNAIEHDEGAKTIFGRTGNWNGDDVVRLCCDRSSCAKFLVGKLYNFLVSETPPPTGILKPLEERFRKSDYDITDVVRTMLGSRLFFSTHAYRKRVKWPVEYAIEAIRTVVPGRIPLSNLVESLPQMGQVLFAPPNVKGWRTGFDWLNSATLLARNNFAESVAFVEWAGLNDNTSTSLKVPVTVPPLGLFVKPAIKPQSEPKSPSQPTKDPIKAFYAIKPKNVFGLIKQMGELLFGEPINAVQTARIESFLSEPMTKLESYAPDHQQPTSNAPGSSPTYSPLGSTSPRPLPATNQNTEPLPTHPLSEKPKLELAPAPREVSPKSKPAVEFGLDSPEFKSRLREALHAMMCMPEYQLN
jgi:hypothetical protein